jgi:hypothetical protein
MCCSRSAQPANAQPLGPGGLTGAVAADARPSWPALQQLAHPADAAAVRPGALVRLAAQAAHVAAI